MTTYETIADLQGLADGSKVTVLSPGGSPQVWEKTAEGLVSDGSVVPFRMFTGSVKQGWLSDGTRLRPEADQWYTSAPAWTFYIHSVEEEHVTYTLFRNTQVSRFQRRITLRQWHEVPRTLCTEPPLEMGDTLGQLIRELRNLYRQNTEYAERINSTVHFERSRSALEQVAARVDDPELDRLLGRFGWARAHTVRVALVITGHVTVTARDMTKLHRGETGVAWSDVHVPFEVRGETTAYVEAGGCACGRNTTALIEAARNYLPTGARPNWQVAGTCENH